MICPLASNCRIGLEYRGNAVLCPEVVSWDLGRDLFRIRGSGLRPHVMPFRHYDRTTTLRTSRQVSNATKSYNQQGFLASTRHYRVQQDDKNTAHGSIRMLGNGENSSTPDKYPVANKSDFQKNIETIHSFHPFQSEKCSRHDT